MEKHRVLITNDDGYRSPLLHSFVNSLEQLDWISDIYLSVPSEEQSWVAQAASRYRPVFSSKFAIGRHAGYKVSGTPADCASLGIDNLFDCRPDYLFSGINIGWNTGLAYYLCSGTVGAVRQAFLGQVKAAAFSVSVPKGIYLMWSQQDFLGLSQLAGDWQRLAEACQRIADILVKSHAWNKIDFFSVNLPWEANRQSEVRLTSIEKTFFKSVFVQEGGNRFVHKPAELIRKVDRLEKESPDQPELPSDIDTVNDGKISLTPISYQLTPETANIASLRQTFEF